MRLMSLKEFNEKYLSLGEDALSAIDELETLTQKPVIFKLVTSQEGVGHFKLKVKLARSFMDSHIVIINVDMIKNKEELNYWIIHEMMHGFRVFEANAQDRKILTSNNFRQYELINEFARTFNRDLVNSIGEEIFKEYCKNLMFNTSMVLFNSSVDARIELGIYNKYPNTRGLQKRMQKEYVKEIIAVFGDKRAQESIPEWILRRVNLMNYCYLLKITPIIGKAWTSKVNGFIDDEFKDTVNKMMVYMDKEDAGQLIDNETIKAWSEILDMKDYVNMVDFENVPLDYASSN